jgi:Fur family ferric uptake transcriptional regulator
MPHSGIQDSLRDRGVRLTRHRRILLDHSGLHHDADSLFQLAREKDPKLNRVTVCRSLKLFKEVGLLDEPRKEIRKQVESHFGFEVVLTRTETGGYCSHCRALRAQEAKIEGAAGAQ